MANQYFVFRQMPEVDTEFTVENETAVHHIFTVMRAERGEKLQFAFDEGKVGIVEVVDPVNHTVKLVDSTVNPTELPVHVTVAVGFPKGDKLDFITEKTTELGASEIWAAPFQWSVAKWDSKKLAKKQEKLEKIARGAAEQSRRQLIPSVNLFDKLSELTDTFSEFDHVLIAYEESAKAGERSILGQTLASMTAGQRILIIFGPEGGISANEIELFEQNGGQKIGLGPRIMRAETAPLYALSAISTYFELLK
ncbi:MULTISPECIES: 16S rRNA (uracil(1498)-N(3))-methyltransferase [unclassified Lactococcus]|uniref:16S rRNA (uracil(1498)-N(3))-methyltransferase n=1 Tax=unclassified Lactococcus TaxID=2643510 RepID=UPI0011CBD1A8|nr:MULTISPECIES: 16S rRNA (uracil(1498)-N(3))-methyltransferase [unclassified Lactococcus]MQW22734.1 16S rRNA (uracil(1498)-N(3))-methyltransferase [Lactococcus sp. dk101]TXK44739.1 16S rRNA (uracil(1498)-N(3))-methyltransferase [Lactococcus sp. dk310]TXK50633.1 16S rRNA (uracil(1498)-N(3))-methyltransferase [Lactococcus sp. dk322]